MSRGLFVLDTKTGEWKEGKASPRLLPENLRSLPADKVTNDEDDETKAHELDPDHVVESIRDNHKQQVLADKIPQAYRDPQKIKAEEIKAKLHEYLEFIPPGIAATLNQKRIDGVRFRIMSALVNRAYDEHRRGAKSFPTLFHVWFPHNNIAEYELRAGPPPSRSILPERMKNMDLVIDLENWPRRIVDALEYAGFEMPKRPINQEMERADAGDGHRVEEGSSDPENVGSLPGLPEPGGAPAKSYLQ